MINLTDMIENIRKEEYDDYNYRPKFSERGAREIRELLLYDRLFNSVTEAYDVVMVLSKDVEIVNGTRLVGDIFFDSKKRFPDGQCIITSTVNEVEKLRHEIYLVKTNNTNYLVIA